MSTNTVTVTRTTPGIYAVKINGELVGQVAKEERRIPVMANDRGVHYRIGSVADPFKWVTLDDRGRAVRHFRTRRDAVESIVRFSTTGR